MNDQEVYAQINQMVQFIHQEAKEKAAEIKLKTDEEFNIEKLRMVEAEKQKIRAEYERKEKHVEVQKRIGQSNEVRLSRLQTLKARDDAMQAVLAEAASKLPSLVSGPAYGALLESLILEALTQLADQKVVVKGVMGQEAATKKALFGAEAKFKAWAVKEMGAEWANGIKLEFDSASLKTGIGGVEVVGFGGKITLTNTLQSRLMLAYETQLPKLRAALFTSFA
jgi:V-type H+-transporting ATPase subunit E